MTKAVKKLTEDDILKTLCNPVYTGIGRYPRIIEDEVWVAAVQKAINEVGAEKVAKTILIALRQSFEP
jgi:hypothetical protein